MIDENNLQDGYTEAMHAWHDALDEVQQLREAREDLQAYADSKDNTIKELVEAVNKYRKSRLITDRKAMFELAAELKDERN